MGGEQCVRRQAPQTGKWVDDDRDAAKYLADMMLLHAAAWLRSTRAQVIGAIPPSGTINTTALEDGGRPVKPRTPTWLTDPLRPCRRTADRRGRKSRHGLSRSCPSFPRAGIWSIAVRAL